MLANFAKQPDPQRARANYQILANAYDANWTGIDALRRRAIDELKLSSGETVFDIACGTGATLPLLAQAVGPSGHVIGIELCPAMADQARRRLTAYDDCDCVEVIEAPVETAKPAQIADALILSFTHDVLQSAVALDAMIAMSRPAARVVILGTKTQPWLWGWPVNVFHLFRARRYVTTFSSMDRPWRMLARRGALLRVVNTTFWSGAYIVAGTLPLRSGAAGARPHDPRRPGQSYRKN